MDKSRQKIIVPVTARVCQEFCPGWGCLPQCMLGYHHPPDQAGTPRDQAGNLPPGPGTPPDQAHPPRSRACWEIRSTSGWYASYFNAILLRIDSWWQLCNDRTCWAEINLWKLRKNSMFVNISNVMMACYPISEWEVLLHWEWLVRNSFKRIRSFAYFQEN